MNQPTAQFYRVALDNDFPYHAYGAQQDNSTVRTATRGRGGITEKDWYDVGGGESGWIAPDLRDTNIVYAGSYGNLITRFDARTGTLRNINPWPDNPMGHPASDLKYRFQWSFPIVISPHDPTLIYAGANVMFKSTDEGQSWTPISGDLTRNDKSRQGSSGGPITKDNTSIEYYDTIFTINESTDHQGLIWVGSDDGLVNLTRDGGKTWQNVTPPKDIMPEWVQINAIEPSPFDPATAYVAATMYKSDDFKPYMYRTTDYGKTWTKIVNGIPNDHFTRVLREDPNRKGLHVRRNGIRDLCFLRFGRPLAVDSAQSARRADHRSRLPQARRRIGGGDARPRVLDHGRSCAAVGAEGSGAHRRYQNLQAEERPCARKAAGVGAAITLLPASARIRPAAR